MFAFVDVNAQAEGLCLAVEKAAPGSDYLFCGPPMNLRELFALWGHHPGAMVPLIWLPRRLARPLVIPMEPLLREPGWAHPAPDARWHAIIRRERELMAGRSGLLPKLRHQATV